MIHGRTKIELYNPSTKIKQIYRDENVFQSSVLANYMRGLGEAVNSPYANSGFAGSKSWINLVGGIFLFKNAIQEGSRYMPAGNKMVCNGSYEVTNNGVPTELGSYNSVESSASMSAITQVYDFTTSQGNGNIGCVCLTSATGGYIGYGNASGEYSTSMRFNFYRNQNLLALNRSNSSVTDGHYAVIGNMLYSFINDDSNDALIVRKTRVAVTKATVFDGFSTETSFDKSEVGNHANWTTSAFCVFVEGQYIYLIAGNQSVPVGGTGYFYKYDTQNDTLVEMSITNSSNVGIILSHTNYGGGVNSSISQGLLFACGGNSKIQIIDISNSVYKGEISSIRAGSFWNKPSSNASDGLVFIHPNGDEPENIYDTVNGTCYPTNGNKQINVESGLLLDYVPDIDAISYGSGERAYLYKNPLYLATINNLQTAVTKTAAQTMKVTYTLTEEEPE